MTDAIKKRGRKRQGTFVRLPDGRLQPIITLADGTKMRGKPLPKGTSEARAREVSLVRSEAALAQGIRRLLIDRETGEPAESGAAWWGRYMEHRRKLGLTSINGLYERHIKPVVDKPWSEVTAEDCKLLVSSLDRRSSEGEIAQKTAFNAWGAWTTAAKAATGGWNKDKAGSLKVCDANPCVGVLPPDFKESKELQWLYPQEFERLISCKLVPLEWRLRYALGVYLFVRGGELKALRWADVDVDNGIVSVRLAYDHEREEVKSTKTGSKGMRRFAIEPALLPLLRAMHEAAGGQGNVVEMPDLKYWASRLREHLELAGVRREALFTTDTTRKRLRFHDLRSTGLTWMAIRGDDPLKIQQRAGHTTFGTTQKYIRAAEEVGTAIGGVFPELPAELIRSVNRSGAAQVLDITVEASGIEPESARHPVYLRSRA